MSLIAGKQQAPFPGIELPSTTVNINLHLTFKMIPPSNGSSNRACVVKGFVSHLVKIQSGFRRGRSSKCSHFIARAQTICINIFIYFFWLSAPYYTPLARLVRLSSSSCVYAFLRFQTVSSTRRPNLSLFCCVLILF